MSPFFLLSAAPSLKGRAKRAPLGALWWCLSECCDLQSSTEHNVRQQTDRRDAHRCYTHPYTGVSECVSTLVGIPLHSDGVEAWRSLVKWGFWLFFQMLSAWRRDTWAAERSGQETWVKAAAVLRPLCFAEHRVVPLLPPTCFGVTATHRSPDPSHPGCMGLFLYFPAFREVISWLPTLVSISLLNLLSHTSTLLQGLCSSCFSKALALSTNWFISSFIKKKSFPKGSLYPSLVSSLVHWNLGLKINSKIPLTSPGLESELCSPGQSSHHQCC